MDEIRISVARLNEWLFRIAVGAVVITFFPVDYAYFGALRLFVCSILAWMAWLIWQRERRKDWKLWALALLAVLYNPILPINLGTEGVWLVTNLAALGLFWYCKERVNALRPAPAPAQVDDPGPPDGT
jgi:hypothetical protein